MTNFIARIAPTPSGFIHTGNAINFILTYVIARHLNATLRLRIDDFDKLRSKKVFIDDIFETLKWLELEYDHGAKDNDDFLKNFSCNHENLFKELNILHEKFPEFFYACKCSRKNIKGIYHGKCKNFGLKLQKGQTSLRLHVKPNSFVKLGNFNIDLYETVGDIIIWQKEGFCSYQLASLLDDEKNGVNLLVRGEDLLNSSAIQLLMANLFGFKKFPKATFIHHPLIFDENGKKLSKSLNSYALYQWRKDGKKPHELFQETAKMIGVREFWQINTKDELLSCNDELETFLSQSSNIHLTQSG
jgi:glutamyl-tRNA synthetase